MEEGGPYKKKANKDISLSRSNPGVSCKGQEKYFSRHSSYPNTGKFVLSVHICDTYYKVGELAHKLKYQWSPIKVKFGNITYEYASFC